MSIYESGLTLNKICVDSRFRSLTSRSDTDFSIELPESVTLPLGTRCYVTDVSLVHAWYTVEENVNDKLYFTYKNASGTFNAILTLPSRNYSLDTLSTTLQELFLSMKVTGPAFLSSFNPTVGFDETTGTIRILTNASDTGQFFIWSDASLANESFYQQWTGGYYDKNFPTSINKLIKNYITQTNSASNPFTSGFVDTITHHNIYIKSPQLGSFQNIGPRGERDILKKVLVTVGFGDLVTDMYINTEDYTDCSRLTLKTLYFRITDVNDVPLNLHGHHVSFSLVFTLG
jgi:hypothetical protein